MDMTDMEWGGCLPVTLPELIVTPTKMQIFMFSAVTWNRHHIHYDRDAAVREGLPDVVAQRALLGNYFARTLSNWLDGEGAITHLAWRVVGSVTPNTVLHCTGVIHEVEAEGSTQRVACDLEMTDDTGRVVATGRAELRRGPERSWPEGSGTS